MTDSSKTPYFVTTAILYANAQPHVGHTFELIGADVMARAKRMMGYDVFFQTGTDEHGQKMLEYAERAGKDPKTYADEVAPLHRELWDALHISYDRFIRTTDADHYAAVERFWNAAVAAGDIYKGSYDGWYCVTDENFVLESQATAAPDGGKICPECGGTLTWKSEESYFFRWTRYQQFLEEWVQQNPHFIAPAFRANEMVNSFLKPGLQDISISRSTIKWGIPVPGDPSHVIYVWFDALINYITGAGYDIDNSRFDRFWPADLHIVGKDILKFHTLLWPAMCKSAGIEPPKRVFGHGFVSPKAIVDPDAEPQQLRETICWEEQADTPGTINVFDGETSLGTIKLKGGTEPAPAILNRFGDKVAKLAKMSKSKGNVVDPLILLERHGGNPDPLRFFLLREIDFGGDGIYSDEALEARYNADLADKIGNLCSRTLTMAQKYFEGRITAPAAYTPDDEDVKAQVSALFATTDTGLTLYEDLINECRFGPLLDRVIHGAQRLNLYISEQQPFRLAKDPEQQERLAAIMYVLCEGIRMLACQLYPFIPGTAEKIWTQLGAPGELATSSYPSMSQWGLLQNVQVERGDNLFPKAEQPKS